MQIPDVQIHGTCDDRFTPVRDAFAANWDPGRVPEEVGASVAITVDGELVVDLWGGTVTGDDGVDKPWERDTIINVWSTTKTLSALCMLILADRGEIDFYSPVAKYWPEFAANGKGDIEVRHIMSHTAGLAGWRDPITIDDLYDWDKATSLLAAQEPWWEPGNGSGYHALTQGYLEGEILRRVTGTTIGDFAAKEVTVPLGADFHIGTGSEHDHRVAHVIPPEKTILEEMEAAGATDSLVFEMCRHPALAAADANTIPWRRAEIPAAGGHANARAVATVHAPMACGGEANGVRLLSAKGIEPVFDEQTYGTDLMLPFPMRHGIGFGLPIPELPLSPNPRACFWGGYGGSLAVIDLDARMSFSYVMNRMAGGTVGDMRAGMLLMAFWMALANA